MATRPTPSDEQIFRAHTLWHLRGYQNHQGMCPVDLLHAVEGTLPDDVAPATLTRVVRFLERLEQVSLVWRPTPGDHAIDCHLPHVHPTKELRSWANNQLLADLGLHYTPLRMVG